MNELALKLKNEVIKQLTINEQNINDEYLVRGNKVYSKREIAYEIETETEFGVEILTGMIVLAIDLVARKK